MRLRVDVDGPELFLGVVALGVSAGYLYQASQIAESLLEDAVGARGVPVAVGWVTAALGLILCVRGLVSRTPEPVAAIGETRVARRPHVLAAGLLSILIAYAGLLPYAGYVISTALLIGAVSRFAGTPFTRSLPIVAILGGFVLWFLFDPLLGTSLPFGSWWGGR